jgi:hypothetical protein
MKRAGSRWIRCIRRRRKGRSEDWPLTLEQITLQLKILARSLHFTTANTAGALVGMTVGGQIKTNASSGLAEGIDPGD